MIKTAVSLPCLVLLVVASAVHSSALEINDVTPEWLPMHVGDRWTYEVEVRDGNGKNPETIKWTQQDRITVIEKLPEGLLVRRKVQVVAGAPPSYLAIGSESNILVHHACLYFLNDSDSYGHGYGWDKSLQGLSADLRRELANGQALPDVCLPLHAGKTWGDPNRGRDLWTVAGLGKKKPDDPVSVTPSCWRLEAHLSSGDDNDVWFQKGVGITAKRTFHNGTFYDYQVRLMRFTPAVSSGRTNR